MIPNIIRKGLEIASGNVLHLAFGVVNILMLNSLLGISQFGIFMLMMSIVNLTAQVSTFSLPNVVFKKIGENKELAVKAGHLANVLYTAFVFSIICYLILFFGAIPINDLLLKSSQLKNFHAISVLVIFTTLINILKSILVSFNMVRRSVFVSLIEVLLRTIGLLVLLINDGVLYHVIWIYIFSAMAGLFGAMLFGLNVIKDFNFFPSINLIWNILKLGNSLFVSSLGVMLVFNVDRLMLGALSNPENVGYYVLASTLSNILLLIHQSFATLFKPYASTMIQRNDLISLEKTYFTLGQWSRSINGVLFLFLNVFSIYILSIFLNIGDETSFRQLLLMLSVNSLMYISVGQSTSLLQMAGGYRKEIFNTLVFLSINFLLNIVLIPDFGAIGAAAATVVSGFIRLVLQVFQIKDLIHFVVIKMNHFFGFVLLVSIAVILLIFEVAFLIQVTICLVYLLLVGFYVFYGTVTRGFGKA